MFAVIEAIMSTKNTMLAVTITATINGAMVFINTLGMGSRSLDTVPIIAITIDTLVGGDRLHGYPDTPPIQSHAVCSCEATVC